MTPSIAIVFGLVLLALVLFAWERVSYDVTALVVCVTLMVTGILTPEEGLAGFANPATITIGAMFVLSEGLRRTGALAHVGQLFRGLATRSRWLAIAGMMAAVGLVSGFINNTAAIAIVIPVVLSISKDLGLSPSKLLMPISFVSMLGGVCTLIGSSTNILVSSIAEDRGLAPFGMFEMAPLGLIFLAVGFVYLATIGLRLTPARRSLEDLTARFGVRRYLTDVLVSDPTVDARAVFADRAIDVVEVFPRETGRVVRVVAAPSAIAELVTREDVQLEPPRAWADAELRTGERELVEAVVAPDAPFVGHRIEEIDFPEQFAAVVLAVRRPHEVQNERLASCELRGGDSLLLSAAREQVAAMSRDPSFVIVSEVERPPESRRRKLPIALLVLGAVVALAAFDVVPIVVGALAGCVALMLTRTLRPREAYESVSWKVIFLLAGVIPLGTAMDRTGAASLLSHLFTDGLGPMGPHVVLAGFFGTSLLLTNVVSNQATAALLAPIAIECATLLEVSARPMLMAVTFAASLSFMTPVGYQTNTLVYGPGSYRFTDFTRVGAPLDLILWGLAVLLIPALWPF
ncbi:MAG: SLC13 family permease [Myxococcota bacterium]|nr:SLC13 family permease [Myxococcota bacterium]